MQDFCGEFGVFVGEAFYRLAPFALSAEIFTLSGGWLVRGVALAAQMEKLTAMHAILHPRRIFPVATTAEHGKSPSLS